jgi:hypothetical protein
VAEWRFAPTLPYSRINLSRTIEPTYPGGSKRRVTRAGEAVRGDRASAENLAVIAAMISGITLHSTHFRESVRPEPPERLHHYTNQKGLLGIFETGAILGYENSVFE